MMLRLNVIIVLMLMLMLLSFAAELRAERQIVTAPMTVGVGDTLRIPAGGEVLFTDFTGVTVNGRLEAIGTKDKPIIFASVNDTTDGGATGFDWNGIEVTPGGSAHFAYCYISGATSGLTAESPGSVVLDDVIFENNGQWNLSLAGEIQNVVDRQPYSHSHTAQAAAVAAIAPAEETPGHMAAIGGSAPATPPRERTPTWSRSRLKWGIGGLGAAAAVGGVVELFRANIYAQKYNAYVPGKAGFDAATPEERQSEFNRLRKGHSTAAIVGWSLIGAAAVDGAYVTFLF